MDYIEWQKHRTHGAQNEKVDLMTRSFHGRVLVWGQGPLIFSPTNPKWLLRNDSSIPKSWHVTEDDVLHASARSLEAVRYQQTLSVEEAHRVLTYLVAPYMRLPLVAHFFADLQRDPSAGGELRAGNRVTYLFTERLQELFSAVLFEQGDFVEDGESGQVLRVPCRRSRAEQDRYLRALRSDARLETAGEEAEQLGAQRGLLENELRFSPESVLKPVLELIRYAVDELCAREQLHTDAAGYVLYIAHCGAQFELHCRDFLTRHSDEGSMSSHNLEYLREGTAEVGNLLRSRIAVCIDDWIQVAKAEVGHDHGWGSLTQNLPTLSVLHAYKALLQVPLICGERRVDPEACRIFLGGVGYVRAHHTYGQLLKIKELSASQQADKDLMERTLCEMLDKFLQAMGLGGEGEARDPMKLKKWIQSDQQVWFTGVRGDQCIRVPLPARGRRSRGFKAPPTEVPEQALSTAITHARRRIVGFLDSQGPGEMGRILADVAVTALGGDHELDSAVQWTRAERTGLYRLGPELTIDVQTGEVLFGGRRIVPVPDDFAEFADFQDLFGRDSLQCYFSHIHENRTWINLVGLRYDLMRWTEPVIDEQGVGQPAPVPKAAFRYPPTEVVQMLNQTPVQGPTGRTTIGRCFGGRQFVAFYFGSIGCGHCRTFTPLLTQLYQTRQDLQVIFVSVDQDARQYQQMRATMPWFSVVHGTQEHVNILQFFKPSGVPHLIIMSADGDFRLATNDGSNQLRQNPTGAGFPWGQLPPPFDPEQREGIRYIASYYSRPFMWYYPEEQFVPEASERWVVDLLQPVLEALWKKPNDAMDHVLYMREDPLEDDEERCLLIGMTREGKENATWREVEVLKQWGTVLIYNLESHGRRMYRRLIFSSKSPVGMLSLGPMTTCPCAGVTPCLIQASGSVRPTREPARSLVIKRWNDNLVGRETLIPTRLLEGVIPGALLDHHRWWQGEDLIIRGEPKNPGVDEWFPYFVEVHVTETGEAIIVKRHSLDEVTSISRPGSRQGSMLLKANKDPGLRAGAAGTSTNILSQNTDPDAALYILTEMGYHTDVARDAMDQATQGGRVDYDEALRILSANDAEGMGPRPKSDAGGTAGDSSKTDAEELEVKLAQARGGEQLLDILRAPSGSALHRLAKVFIRIEDMGHILVWGTPADEEGNFDIRQIELPRLHLRFDVRESASGKTRIYSKDYSDWYVTDLQDECLPDGSTPPPASAARVYSHRPSPIVDP